MKLTFASAVIWLVLSSMYNTSAFGQSYIDDSDYLESLERAQILRQAYPGWLDTLAPCPCTATQARNDERFEDSTTDLTSEFHIGASVEFRTKAEYVTPFPPIDSEGLILMPGQQCTYASNGRLITHGPAAGTPDAYSPTVTYPGEGIFFEASHEYWDVDTFDPNGYDLPFFVRTVLVDWAEPSDNRIEGLPWYVYTQTWIPNNGNNCPAYPDTNSLYVEVDERDFEGRYWDTWLIWPDDEEPEIEVCFIVASPLRSACGKGPNDSHIAYTSLPSNFPQRNRMYFQVYDIDRSLGRREPIGEGHCNIDEVCRIGKARIFYMSSPQ